MQSELSIEAWTIYVTNCVHYSLRRHEAEPGLCFEQGKCLLQEWLGFATFVIPLPVLNAANGECKHILDTCMHSQGAIVVFTRSLAQQLVGKGIRGECYPSTPLPVTLQLLTRVSLL